MPLKRDLSRVRKLLRPYYRTVSSVAAKETIAKDMALSGDNISYPMIDEHRLALKRLFIIEELEAWNPNLCSNAAIRTKSTYHFVNPSIVTVALGLNEESIFLDMRSFGLLFESLAIRDLRIYATRLGQASTIIGTRPIATPMPPSLSKAGHGPWSKSNCRIKKTSRKHRRN